MRITRWTHTLPSVSTELYRTTRSRARLTRQGQITVPKVVRDALGARPGDDIEFVSRGAEFILAVRPRRSVLDFAGIAREAVARIPVTAEDLDEMVGRGLAAEAVDRERQTRPGRRRTP